MEGPRVLTAPGLPRSSARGPRHFLGRGSGAERSAAGGTTTSDFAEIENERRPVRFFVATTRFNNRQVRHFPSIK